MLDSMSKFDTEQKSEAALGSKLERELADNAKKRKVLEENSALLTLEDQANQIKYESSQGEKESRKGGLTPGEASDLYKHDDMYKGDEYLPNEKKQYDSSTDSNQQNSAAFKSEIDKMVDKTTDMYKRNQ